MLQYFTESPQRGVTLQSHKPRVKQQPQPTGNCLPSLKTGLIKKPVSTRNIIYFDLETQRSFNDVGGSSHKDKMGISVAVTYSTITNSYEIYHERELDRLADELVRADLVVGWNHLYFDYPVLQAHVFHTLAEQTVNLDMMVELEKIIGFRLKLDSVASATLGTGKSGDGLDALRWWQEHKKTGEFAPLRKIAEYCSYDVKVTRCVHEYALKNGRLKYKDKAGRMVEVAVDWS
jgi:uncharacterized protein YprB with RNaseH-like and TPR domain